MQVDVRNVVWIFLDIRASGHTRRGICISVHVSMVVDVVLHKIEHEGLRSSDLRYVVSHAYTVL
jgi:hypothetical protein